jgi:hypothetical protein
MLSAFDLSSKPNMASLLNNIKQLAAKQKNLIVLYLVAWVLIALKVAFLDSYDNYLCFKFSHTHLLHNLDLYLMYPQEYHTEYNYSPFFSFFMGLFAYLPDWLGILCWNLFNTIPLLYAIHKMPLSTVQKNYIYLFCLIEFITAAENVQTNATVTALILLVFINQQKGNTTLSSFFFVFGAFFKIYVLTAGVFFLIYPKRGHFIWKSLLWGCLFFLMPLTVISWDQLLFLHRSWFERLQAQAIRDALSLLGIVNKHISAAIKQEWIMLGGTLTVLAVLFKKALYSDLGIQLRYTACILLFTVAFNPGVESPSYIIAVAGSAIWYVLAPRKNWEKIVMALVFIFTCLSPTEIFPRSIREDFMKPYHIKAIPIVILWVIVVVELFRYSPSTEKKLA